MILTTILMVSLYGLSLAQGEGMERIQECKTRCSKGLHCKSKTHYSFAPCRTQKAGLNTSVVFHNVSLSTVMRCEGKQKCSLHFRVHTALQLSEHIHGISICTVTAGMMLEICRLVSFPRVARERLEGQQLEVQNDCSEVWPGQYVHVTLKTNPSYCGVTWTSTYQVPECSSRDLRSNIPECITGRLAYTVDSDRKELAVSVSDMLEDKDYHLRLCHRKDYTCRDTGANALIRKEDVLKNTTLQYSTPLPCLCIEGWSATSDAPRVQVFPFRDNLEELWSGINFDPVEELLSWEPVCPVVAVISLCQKQGYDECDDLAGSSQTLNREKITFSTVDPHPQLCMKFTTDSGSWIRCPFADGNFQAWDLGVDQLGLVLTSRVRAPLSLHVCVKTGTSACHPEHTLPVHVEKSANLNLTVDVCLPNTCVQVKRLNVKYAVTILHCHIRCLDLADARGRAHAPAMVGQTPALQGYLELIWVVVPAVACLTAAVIVAALVIKALITVHQRRHRKGRHGVCTLKQQTESHAVAVDRATPGLQDQTTLHKEMPIPYTLPFENCERHNLLQF
ncbi:putative interleukin-17 receptor E-like [Oncorhynchus tshawytscha]|uniref:Interleukin-17 receptor C/E N-terminal domain-containing protein n=1 Tax=Oncorhynchus tshawytscha TaxID=74940 RepID=A0A8C8MHH1_ONCTS|nr:putative interleukin-17 receptor E-like [Oncorhynchus tshawytscha]